METKFTCDYDQVQLFIHRNKKNKTNGESTIAKGTTTIDGECDFMSY